MKTFSRRKLWDLKGHPKAHHQLIIVRENMSVIAIMEPKITLLLINARVGFLNSHLIKYGQACL